jgi:hypothetical protein
VEDDVLTDREDAEVQDSLRTGISRHGEKNCSGYWRAGGAAIFLEDGPVSEKARLGFYVVHYHWLKMMTCSMYQWF